MKRFAFSLKIKIVCSFLLLIMVSAMVIGFYSNYSAKIAIHQTVGKAAEGMIKTLVKKVDTEKFESLRTRKDMQNSYYKKLRNFLNNYRELAGLKYLYTMRRTEDNKYIYVVDGEPKESKNASLLGDVENTNAITKIMIDAFNGSAGHEFSYTKNWGNLISAYIPIKNDSGKVIGILGADFDANTSVKQLDNLNRNIYIIVIIIVALGIVVSMTLGLLLTKSLKRLIKQVEIVKNGDLTVDINTHGDDEVGVLSKAFNETVSSLLVITKDIHENTDTVLQSIDYLTENFSQTLQANEKVSSVINEVASGSMEQSKGVDEMSASMDRVFKQVTRVADNAKAVSASSQNALKDTEDAASIFTTSIQKVNKANDTMEHAALIIQELGDKSKKISSFSETISGIAGQTKLLAINASIEATSAGEHGKGFAVVAEEIRKLSEQSSEATVQIIEIIKAIQEEMDEAIKIIITGADQSREGVNSVEQLNTYLQKLQGSNRNANTSVKEIIDSIYDIEDGCRSALGKASKVADLSRNFNEGSKQAVVYTQEQLAIMQQVEAHLDSIKQMTHQLDSAVNRFKTKA